MVGGAWPAARRSRAGRGARAAGDWLPVGPTRRPARLPPTTWPRGPRQLAGGRRGVGGDDGGSLPILPRKKRCSLPGGRKISGGDGRSHEGTWWSARLDRSVVEKEVNRSDPPNPTLPYVTGADAGRSHEHTCHGRTVPRPPHMCS